MTDAQINAIFLSCLCGSERYKGDMADFLLFLSCLCGSEHKLDALLVFFLFLSCLCGSEHAWLHNAD